MWKKFKSLKVIKGSNRPPKCFNNFVNEKLPNAWMSSNGLSNFPQTIIDLQQKKSNAMMNNKELMRFSTHLQVENTPHNNKAYW